MTTPTPEHPLDVAAMKRLPRQQYALPPDFVARSSVQVDGPTWDAILAELEGLRKLADFVEGTFENSDGPWEMGTGRRHLANDPEDGPSSGEEGYIIVELDSDLYLTWTPHKGGAEMLVDSHNELVCALEQAQAIVHESRRPAARAAEEER